MSGVRRLLDKKNGELLRLLDEAEVLHFTQVDHRALGPLWVRIHQVATEVNQLLLRLKALEA